MGELADTARKNSNFLKIEKHETVTATYLGFRKIPSTMDPAKDTIQYKFGTPFGEKFWTNGNSRIMLFFDKLQPGVVVAISRKPWINKDNSEDTSKSTYEVDEVKEDN